MHELSTLIVCYAQGDGLGHLTRLRAFLHTVRPDRPVTVLTGSRHAGDPRVLGGLPVLPVPTGLDRTRLSAWIAGTLADLAPDELVVDAFPAGIAGELTQGVVPAGTRITHLARLLRWDAYRPMLPEVPVRFDRTWLIEPVTGRHHAHLCSISTVVEPLELIEPPAARPDDAAVELARDAWLIVHTGPAAELDELVGYARDTAAMEGSRARLVLVSPMRPADLPREVAHLDVYPAWPLFPVAERIFTAAGCNAIQHTEPWRSRQRVIPFPRRYDDQFTRAARLFDRTPVPS